MILGDHTEYLTGPGFQGPRINSGIVGLESLKGNIAWGQVFTIHAVVNLANGLPSRLCSPDRIGRPLGAQMFPLQPPRGFFGTNRSRCHRPLLPSLGVGQLGPLRQFASRLCLQRLVYRLGWRWMPFHPGSRWMSFHPGLRWTFSRPDQRLVGLHPDAFQRLQLPGSQFGSTSAGEVNCLVGPWVLWVSAALGGEGRPGAGPTVPVSSDSSLRALSIL